MKRLSTLVTTLALASLLVILAGCSQDSTPTGTAQLSPEEQEIQTFLESSEYALPMEFHSDEEYENEGVLSVTQDTEDGVEILPWVRFFRIMRSRPWAQYVIRIPGSEGPGTADVRIIHHLRGTFVVENTDDGIRNPFYRPFGSVGVTNLMLRRIEDNWRIVKVSPTDILSSNDGGTTIRIAWVRAEGSSHLFPETIIMSPDTLLELNELPAFAPGDTVRVAARAFNANVDGSWLFLHVHASHHASLFHMRIPFVRDESDPTLFYARWIVGPGMGGPRVLHVAVDAIDWNTLFGNKAAIYNSRMWSIPCVIGMPLLAEE